MIVKHPLHKGTKTKLTMSSVLYITIFTLPFCNERFLFSFDFLKCAFLIEITFTDNFSYGSAHGLTHSFAIRSVAVFGRV